MMKDQNFAGKITQKNIHVRLTKQEQSKVQLK